VKHSNYRTADIYRLLVEESRGTTPNPYKLFVLDIPEGDTDLGPADAMLIRKLRLETTHV
jgi:hypothetical protein